MSTIERLRSTLEHNASDPNAVGEELVERQLATASALRDRLDTHGGVILGDEVGAGKTFVTFAVLADTLLREPDRGAVIFVPTDPLQRKWARQLRDYLELAVRDRGRGRELAGRVRIMGRSLYVDEGEERIRPKKNHIVLAQHGTFSRQTSDWDRAKCLERWLDLRCPRERRPRQKLFAACNLDRSWLNPDWETWSSWANDDVLTKSTLEPLDVVFDAWEQGNRDLRPMLRSAVLEVRRNVGRKVLPDAALVVVDEAHNLKSTHSQVYQSLMRVLSGRFDAMLFLTATPFQLGRQELRNIVEFFRSSSAATDDAAFDRRISDMEAGMNGYVEALSAFGGAWRDLADDERSRAEALLAAGDVPTTEESVRVRAVTSTFENAMVSKRRLEAGLRPFLVRSVRERYHRELRGVGSIAAGSRIPIALVDRLIAERFEQGDRTFVSSALTSACSSWSSLFAAAIAQSDQPSSTLLALRKMQERELLGTHPKLQSTIDSCLSALAAGEKTLVFVERAETGSELREALLAELGTHHDSAAQARLQVPTRFGWPSLRENYLHTLFPLAFGRVPDVTECLAAVSLPAMRKLWTRVDVADAPNYKIGKRFIEHAVFRAAATETPGWATKLSDATVGACVENVLEEDYIVNGIDLLSGDGERVRVRSSPVRSSPRDLSDAFVRAYVAYPSPWASSIDELRLLGPEPRAALIDAAAVAIASSHLQGELADVEADGDPGRHFAAMERLLCGGKAGWRPRFEAIAQQGADLATDSTASSKRVEGLAAALKASRRVQFVSGGTAGDTKAHAIDGFNTPMYPEILIATSVLAEGIDLHRACRRVIHHDLPWNPAKLEQRTGRVDRIGSMAARLQEDLGDVDESAIQVGLPYVAGTYDETIFLRVLARRREFRCLLGSRPEWDDDVGTAESAPPFPEDVVRRLQTELGPNRDVAF